MAFKSGNRVRETTSTTGTGNLTLTGAVAGHIAFDSAMLGMANGDAVNYACVASNGQWEVGNGLYLTGPRRLWRLNPRFGSDGQNTNTNFSVAPEVFITTLAADSRTWGAHAQSTLSANQVISAATTTKIQFDTNDFNTGGNDYSSAIWNTLTAHSARPTEDGFYRMFAKVDATTTFSGDSYLAVFVNNVETRRGPTLSGVKSLWVDAEVNLNGSGDFADFRINTAGGGTIAAGPTLSHCLARWVRKP